MLVMLAIAIVTPPSSATQGEVASHLDRVKASKVLRVCIWPDYYSITYRNPKTQQLSGIDIDMANELGKDLGVAVRFVDSSFAKLIIHIFSEAGFIDQIEAEFLPGNIFEAFCPHLPMCIKRLLCGVIFPKIKRFIESGINTKSRDPV